MLRHEKSPVTLADTTKWRGLATWLWPEWPEWPKCPGYWVAFWCRRRNAALSASTRLRPPSNSMMAARSSNSSRTSAGHWETRPMMSGSPCSPAVGINPRPRDSPLAARAPLRSTNHSVQTPAPHRPPAVAHGAGYVVDCHHLGFPPQGCHVTFLATRARPPRTRRLPPRRRPRDQ